MRESTLSGWSNSIIQKYIDSTEVGPRLNLNEIRNIGNWSSIPFYRLGTEEEFLACLFEAFKAARVPFVYGILPHQGIEASDVHRIPTDLEQLRSFAYGHRSYDWFFIDEGESVVALTTIDALCVIAGESSILRSAIGSPVEKLWLEFREAVFCQESLVYDERAYAGNIAKQNALFNWGRDYEISN
jgi:hypothetical protein